MKKHILSLITLLAFSSTINAQEMLYDATNDGGKKYTVADIQSIDVINVKASLPDILASHPEYSIFSEALEKTELADTISAWNKDKTYHVENNYDPTDNFTRWYFPEYNYIKFTVFAVDNETFRSMGVTDFNSLKAKCAEWYGGASAWYDYPGKGSKSISTGNDYTYTYNVVNMFLRYHILKAGMKYDELVLNANNKDKSYWNFAFGGEPYNYYETLLPHTIMKIWQPLYHNTGSELNIWINRYRANNTLTDQIGLFGSEAMHQLIDTGALVDSTKSDIKAINGFIHNVSKPLIYSSQVANGVLNERLRIKVSDMLHELSSNGMKHILYEDLYGKGYSSSRCIFRNDYFDNLYVKGDSEANIFHEILGVGWRAWGAEDMQIRWAGGSEPVEVLLRLPSVPTGEYELRLPFHPNPKGAKIAQAYIGTEPNIGNMTKLGDEFDMTINPYETNIGYMDTYNDYGELITLAECLRSDATMRTNGYMRMPASFSRGIYNTIKEPVSTPQTLLNNPIGSVRFEEGYGTLMLRKILGTVRLEQDKEYWLGFKLTVTEGMAFWLDFIEFVPVSIVSNTTYTEDWY